MKRMLVFAALVAPCCVASSVEACGYGMFDADVELFVSGDPIQAEQAWKRLLKRGAQAREPVRSYYRMAQRSERSMKRHLERLQRGDLNAQMTPDKVVKEVIRSQEFLKHNRQRMHKLRVLMVHVTGDLLTGEPWGAAKLTVA